jgi:hypothetical protein
MGPMTCKLVMPLLKPVQPPAIPPRRRARLWQQGNAKDPRGPRDETLRSIRRVGRKRWRRACGYRRRSLAETAVYRVKTLFGDRVRAHRFEGQAAELLIR